MDLEDLTFSNTSSPSYHSLRSSCDRLFISNSHEPLKLPLPSCIRNASLITYPRFPSQVRPGEPVYAQVDREKKKNSRAAAAANAVAGDHGAALPQYNHNAAYADYSEHAEHWHQQQQQPPQQQQHVSAPQQSGNAAAGDSWV